MVLLSPTCIYLRVLEKGRGEGGGALKLGTLPNSTSHVLFNAFQILTTIYHYF